MVILLPAGEAKGIDNMRIEKSYARYDRDTIVLFTHALVTLTRNKVILMFL